MLSVSVSFLPEWGYLPAPHGQSRWLSYVGKQSKATSEPRSLSGRGEETYRNRHVHQLPPQTVSIGRLVFGRGFRSGTSIGGYVESRKAPFRRLPLPNPAHDLACPSSLALRPIPTSRGLDFVRRSGTSGEVEVESRKSEAPIPPPSPTLPIP